MKGIFKGSGVALVTPYTDSGIDYDALKGLITFHQDNGTDALIINGTTGEPSTMSSYERTEVLSTSIEHNNGKLPLIAGTGGNNTREVISSSIKAEQMGADALLIVTPYYNKTTQDGLVAHYYAVADSVNIPIIVYNVPARTGMSISANTLVKLAEHPNIRGMKEASGDISLVTDMVAMCTDKNIAFYSGNDDMVLPLMALGGNGVISVAANIIPLHMHRLAQSFLNGDIVTSRNLQLEINNLLKLLFCETSPIPVKAAMEMMGFPACNVRLPLVPMTDTNKLKLKAEMQKLKLI